MIIDLAGIEAFAFDLDGVVTKTASVHAAAWKQVFDELLADRSPGAAWAPFSAHDYEKYVDGRPRRDGIRTFLAARGISLPEGDARDGAERATVNGLATRKHERVRALLAERGVAVYPDAVDLLHRARGRGLGIAVVTASEDGAAVLEAAGVAWMFDARVDGRDAIALRLRGKPAPDTYVEAARRLGCRPRCMAMFEDAIAGVHAGREGGFGRVVGVDRVGRGDALAAAGATDVVTSLTDVGLTGTREDFACH